MASACGRVARRDERIGIAAAVTAGFGAAAVLVRDVAGLHLACPLRTLSGIPCPGCGMTTVASSLGHGDVSGALGADPAGVALVLVVAALVVAHLVGRRWPALGRTLPADGTLLVVGAGALAAHWATTLLTG